MAEMRWSEVPDLKSAHAEKLDAAAILPEVAASMGVRSATTRGEGIIFPYRGRNGELVNVFRPDDPGEGPKYRWEGGKPLHIAVIRDAGPDCPVILCEGTKQPLSVASWAPPGYTVLGMNGCWGWVHEDLSFVVGREVLTIFDGDLRRNRDVYDAASKLDGMLSAHGATRRYVHVPAPTKERNGIDDLLGATATEHRAAVLARLMEAATAELGRAPARRRPAGAYIDPDLGLRTEKLAHDVLDQAPAALTAEHNIAMYRDGVYLRNGTAFTAAVGDLLGDDFRTSYRRSVEEFCVGLLHREGRLLPDRAEAPLLNVANGMVDLATSQLRNHDPAYLSSVQLPVAWDPQATAPTYERWLAEVVGDQGDDLEETVSAMLDPSRTPPKAAFLFGPSRSGKSTYLRLLEALAGPDNRAAVTLHQLSTNRFMAANVYGKVLNSAADLSAGHVEDLSLFKMLTGEDSIQADRKFGQQFTFTNRALFAFSANEVPTVGESSRAYSERIKPFRFGRSFAGREDPSIEEAMRKELPGILVRLVRAWQRRHARGRYADTAPEVAHEFEVRSDRVRQWVAETATVVAVTAAGVAVTPGMLVGPSEMTSKRDLARQFNFWANYQGASTMGERKIIDRLSSINGVVEVRNKFTKGRAGFNIVAGNPGDDDARGSAPRDESITQGGKGGRSGRYSTTSLRARQPGEGGGLARGGELGETATSATPARVGTGPPPAPRFPDGRPAW